MIMNPKKIILLLSEYSIMDCIYDERERTFYIIDLTCWKGHPIYDSEVIISLYSFSDESFNNSTLQGAVLNFLQILSGKIKFRVSNLRFRFIFQV